MNAVERELLIAGREHLERWRVEVDESRACFISSSASGLSNRSQIRIQFRPVRQVGTARVFVSNRAEQHESRVDSLFFPKPTITLDQLYKLTCVGIRTARSSKRFVVAVKREDDVRRDMLQVLSIVRETLVPGALVDHVSREAHVPEADVQAFQLTLQNGLDPRSVLHAVGESVAINGDNVVLPEGKILGSIRRRRRQNRGADAENQQSH